MRRPASPWTASATRHRRSTQGLRWAVDPKRYTNTSPPVIYKDLVILGNGVGDRLDVQERSARRRPRLRCAHRQAGLELPHDSDGRRPETRPGVNESWKVTGHANVWAPFTVDTRAGSSTCRSRRRATTTTACTGSATTSSPTRSCASMRRPVRASGTSRSPITASGTTTRRQRPCSSRYAWAEIGRRGRAGHETGVRIRVRSRHRQTGVADRGARRARQRRARRAGVADAAVPDAARRDSPQGVTMDDAFDLTPELKAQAQEQMKTFRLGPLYTPPSLAGHVACGPESSAARTGAARRSTRTRGLLYIKTSNAPAVVQDSGVRSITDEPSGRPKWTRTSSAAPAAARRLRRATRATAAGDFRWSSRPTASWSRSILNTGDIAWRVPFGDTPEVRTHPALAGVKLPDRLGAAGVGGVIVDEGRSGARRRAATRRSTRSTRPPARSWRTSTSPAARRLRR